MDEFEYILPISDSNTQLNNIYIYILKSPKSDIKGVMLAFLLLS